MATAQEVIKQFMASLDKTTLYKPFDEAVQASSKFSSWQSVIDSMVADCAAYGGDGTSFLKDKCGIILSNADTGAITGADAGSGVEKTAESIVPEDPNSYAYPTSGTSTFYGLTVTWPNQSSLTDTEKYIIGALNSWWIPNGLKLVKDSYDLSFEEEDATVKAITVNFVNESSSTLAYVRTYYEEGDAVKLSLNINMKYYGNLSLTNLNGISEDTSFYLDRTIAHELTHAVVSATVYNSNSLPLYFEEGLAELTHGIDDERKTEIKSLASNSSTLAKVLAANTNAGTYSYAGGYMLLRYFACQASDAGAVNSPSTPNGATLDGTTLTLGKAFEGSLWLEGTDLFSGEQAYRNESVIRIDASQATNEIILTGNKQDNWILGGSGSSSLWGGSGGNDTLQGGSGQDMFWFGSGCGKDYVTGFTVGNEETSDILNIYTAGLNSITRNNGIITIKMSDNASLELNAGTDINAMIQYSGDGFHIQQAKIGNTKESNQISYDGIVNFFKGGNSTDTLVVSGKETHNVWLDGSKGQGFDSIENIDGSSSSGADQLAGNGASNLILGGSGSQSLWGGVGGNDTLQGGSGQDMFFYGLGNGNDVVTNTSGNDVVNLYDISLGDIAYANVSSSEISVGFHNGETLSVKASSSSSPAFVLGRDHSTWKYDYRSSSWKLA